MKEFKNSVSVLAACIFFILGVSPCLLAQGKPQDTPAAAVRRSGDAHGAQWKSGHVNSVAEGTLERWAIGKKGEPVVTETVAVTLSQQGTEKMQRVLTDAKGLITRQGTDGVRSWNTQPGPFGSAAPSPELQQFIESQTTRSIQAFVSANNLSLSDLGSSSKGRGIETTDSQNKKTTYFINPKTDVIERIEFSVGQMKDIFGKTVPLNESYVLSDFRSIQGLLTPFKIERFRGMVKLEEMRFTTVSFPANIPDSVFTPGSAQK